MTPNHSISICPICGGGLCGIRVCDGPIRIRPLAEDCEDDECGAEDCETDERSQRRAAANCRTRHGLIVCDECEAIWLSPDCQTDHLYTDPEFARCPVCGDALWGASSHWATADEVAGLGWERAIDRRLDFSTDEGIA